MSLIERQKAKIEYFVKQKNAKHELVENVNILRFNLEVRGELKPALALFIGKSTKPTNHYWYPSLEIREKTIEEVIARQRERKEAKEKRRKERVAFKPTSKPNDIFVCSWGYEQTNVDFYLLLEVKGKTGTFIAIGSLTVEGSEESHGMACEVVANPKIKIGEPFKKQILLGYGSEENINLASYKYCHKWSGKPKSKSWYY